MNHLSHITNDPHFNEYLERYENSNAFSNPNSTEVGHIAYTNHLKSFTDNDFVNSVTGISVTGISVLVFNLRIHLYHLHIKKIVISLRLNPFTQCCLLLERMFYNKNIIQMKI